MLNLSEWTATHFLIAGACVSLSFIYTLYKVAARIVAAIFLVGLLFAHVGAFYALWFSAPPNVQADLRSIGDNILAVANATVTLGAVGVRFIPSLTAKIWETVMDSHPRS